MHLSKLFKTQKLLDIRIVDEHNLHGQDLLPQKILSLQVELGELAQNWRGFKFWSRDREPITTKKCWNCSGEGTGYFVGMYWTGEKLICVKCEGTGIDGSKNPLLEEYVDCLHFILSIGNELNFNLEEWDIEPYHKLSILYTFNHVYRMVGDFETAKTDFDFVHIIDSFLGLGEMLGFTHEQIEQSYYQKNAINHTRQDNSY